MCEINYWTNTRQIEVFLVDDGSPDNCGAICDEYAKHDERIIVIHKENGGLSSARNAALDIATGEYIMFVDSDDWVEPDFCATALKLAQEHDAQVVSFGYNMVWADRDGKLTSKQEKRIPSRIGFMDASKAVRHLIMKDYPAMGNYVCNKLFRHSLWNDVRFPEGRVWEDQAVTYLMILRAGQLYISDVVLYNYLQRPDSTVGAMDYSPQMYADLFAILQDRLPIIRQYCPENEYFQIMQMGDLAVSGLAHIRKDSQFGQTRKEMEKFLNTNKNTLLHGGGRKNTMKKLHLYYYCRPLLPVLRYATEVKRFLGH